MSQLLDLGLCNIVIQLKSHEEKICTDKSKALVFLREQDWASLQVQKASYHVKLKHGIAKAKSDFCFLKGLLLEDPATIFAR